MGNVTHPPSAIEKSDSSPGTTCPACGDRIGVWTYARIWTPMGPIRCPHCHAALETDGVIARGIIGSAKLVGLLMSCVFAFRALLEDGWIVAVGTLAFSFLGIATVTLVASIYLRHRRRLRPLPNVFLD